MEEKGSPSIKASSIESNSKKRFSLKVNVSSRRGSIHSTGGGSSNDHEDVPGNGKDLKYLPSKFKPDSDALKQSKLNFDYNFYLQKDLIQSKRKAFGDARPVVKKVWEHYPEMEIESPPKDPRERLNKLLDRNLIEDNFSAYAQSAEAKPREASDCSSIAEDDDQGPLMDDPPQNLDQKDKKRPTSARAKIDSQTKLKDVVNVEDEKDPTIRDRDIASKIIREENIYNFNPKKGKFKKALENYQKEFIIKKPRVPVGVQNEKIWKVVPVSPHLDKVKVQLPDLFQDRKKFDLGWNKKYVKDFSNKNLTEEARVKDKITEMINLGSKPDKLNKNSGKGISAIFAGKLPESSQEHLMNTGLIEELSQQYFTTYDNRTTKLRSSASEKMKVKVLDRSASGKIKITENRPVRNSQSPVLRKTMDRPFYISPVKRSGKLEPLL